MTTKHLSSTLALILLIGWPAQQAVAQQTIEGVWQVSKIERDVKRNFEQSVNENPLPSLVIFTKSHYSITWIPGDAAPAAFATRWEPTEEEKALRFGLIVVNTGTYEVEENKIKATPIINRNPEFAGGLMIYEYEWVDQDLVLTMMEEYSFDGVPAPWTQGAAGKIHVTLTRADD